MRLLHLSDTHLHDPRWSTYHPEIDSAARLDAVLAATREHGPFDAIVLTGGLSYSKCLVEWVRERVQFMGKFMVYPGEDELLALSQGALRVLHGEETAKVYE